MLPFVVIWWFLMKRMGKGGVGGKMSIGKSKATEITAEMSKISCREGTEATGSEHHPQDPCGENVGLDPPSESFMQVVS